MASSDLTLPEGGSQTALSDAEIQALLNEADVIAGRIVVPAEELVGTPFLITQVTFRHSDYGQDGRAWVSLEAIRLDNREEIVLNDGGVGIPVSMAEYVKAKGIKGVTAQGEVIDPATDDVLAFVQGHADNRATFEVKLFAKNGTRISSYTHPKYGQSETAYLG